ncbi:MAG: hypothetical protein EOO04_28810 [Chitinophagaceae bacterium]|nr:MAG: hypothetical protein EOO04_28810 [Chitinophagaceae bacterium]
MKNNMWLTGMIILSFFLFSACQKSNDIIDTPPVDEAGIPPVNDDGKTPVGSPVGAASRKTVDAKGGQLSSADGRIQVVIPAGALESAKEISIQGITSELPGGIGNAYRLLPHGEQFKKGVTVIFNYKKEDLAGTLPEFLDIAYQDNDGSWLAASNPTVDKTNRKLSISTTHFSDWGYFKSLNLTPEEATVELGGNVALKISTRFPYIDPDDVPAGQTTIKVLREPRELRADEIKKWTYTGNGILISRASQAFYTAPDEEPDTNPEAVTATINLHRKGQFMLVSNITVLAGHGVSYLHVDENFKSPVNNGNCMLYMYGSFGADPGMSKRLVKINGNVVEADLWSPGIIRCKIDREISGAIEIIANNKTVARSVLRKYTGNFLYERFQGGKTNSRSTNPLKETTEFKIVYRGFGAPCPAGVNPTFLYEQMAAFGTRADYTLGGAAAVTTPGSCPTTTSVSLNAASGTLLLNTISGSRDTRLECAVKDIVGGIEIRMQFRVIDVITGVKVQRSTCNFTSFDTPKPLDVSFEGFSNQPIILSFTEPGGLAIKSSNKIQSPNLSSDILIEAWDGTGSPSHYQTDGLMPAIFSNK